MTQEDLTGFIARGIRELYVKTGRSGSFNENMFTREDTMYTEFADTLPLDESEYVLISAEIAFYQKVQSSVDKMISYTTDALSVSHGDKPYANLKNTLEERKAEQRIIWYKMTRFHHL